MHIYHNHDHATPYSKTEEIRQMLAIMHQLKKSLSTSRPELAERIPVDYLSMEFGIPLGPFAQEQLQALAEEFKKNGFELTPALADDLQDAAEKFIIQRHRYEVTLPLSEERKDYQAFCDLFAELTKRLRSWRNPWIRVQFFQRLLEPYFEDGKEIDEAFCGFADLTTRFGRRKFVLEMLIQAEQLSQTLHRLFAEVLHGFPEGRPGRRKDWPLRTFIRELKPIWETGTGKKAGISRHPLTGKIGGPFVRFVRTCLTYLEPEKSYPSLGERISKLLQSETVPLNWKNPLKK